MGARARLRSSVWALAATAVLLLGAACALAAASQWLRARRGLVRSPAPRYDYIVVGAGTAGCVVASHLVNDATKPTVLLVEAGELFPWWSSIPLVAPMLQETSHDWAFHTVPQTYSSWGLNNATSAWPRGKGVGGSGHMNYMIHFAGIEKDFQIWKKLGVEGWNYTNVKLTMENLLLSSTRKEVIWNSCTCSSTYKSLLMEIVNDTCPRKARAKIFQFNEPKVQITTHFPEISGLLSAFLNGGKELRKLGYNMSFFAPVHSTIKNGYRWSNFDGFLKPALAKENLHVLLKTAASKVLFTETKKAIGIEMIMPTKQIHRVYSNKEIILCAGSIKTPHILLLSGIGPQKDLQQFGLPLVKNLPVGLGLHDHMNMPLYVSIEKPISITMDKVLKASQLLQYILFGKGYLASSGIVGGASVLSNDVGVVLFGLGSVDENLLRRIANYKINTFRSLFPFSDNTSQEGFVLLPSCLQPLSRGVVSLQSSDPTQQPALDPQYLTETQDIACMARAIRFAARLVETRPFRYLGAQLHLPLLDECKKFPAHVDNDAYLECLLRTAAITGYHPGGTCKMGKSTDPTSVVDSYFRVHGTSGLRVVDASVMPTPISGHPNSIITTFSEIAASFILHSKGNNS